MSDKMRMLEAAVQGWLLTEDLPLHPKGAALTTFEDALDQEGVKVTLTLPKPTGATWDGQEVFRLRRAVGDFVDLKGRELEVDLPGAALVTLTSDELDDKDVAEDDGPQPGEDPGEEVRAMKDARA